MRLIRLFRRYFLPSRTFGRYMARLFLLRLLALAFGVAAVLQMLDLVDVSDAILAVEGNGSADVWRYLSLRFPDLLSRFIPFSALLAVLLTLAQLNRSSEIVVMKAAGLSPHRILLPMGLVCAVVAVAHFLFDQSVVAPAKSELAYWQQFDYAADLPPPPDVLDEVWLIEDSATIRVEAVSRSGNRVILDRVTIFEADQTGLVSRVVRADFAWYAKGYWTLFSVRTFDVETHRVTIQESRPWGLQVGPGRFFSLSVNPEHVSFGKLLGAVEQLGAEGLPTDALRTALFQKIAGPAATLLMPLLGAVAGFGSHRRGQLFARVTVGMALGFSFFVADNLLVAIGQVGAIPPSLAAFGPFALFLTVGFALLFFTEE